MYLLTLNNLSYIYITLFFIILIISPYIYRRKNKTSRQFLYVDVTSKNKLWSSANLGIIEFVVLCFLGAKFGLSGYYYSAIAILISFFIMSGIKGEDNSDSLASVVRTKLNNKLGILVAIFQMLCYSFLICVSIVLTAKIFQALLGWSFINSVLSIVTFTFVYSLIGGIQAIRINNYINMLVVSIICVLTLICAYIKTGDINVLVTHLKALATSQGHTTEYYLAFNYGGKAIKYAMVLAISLLGLNLLTKNINFKQKIRSSSISVSLLLKLIVVYMVVLLGIIAIGTNANVKSIDGKKIVTYQAQLSDGQIGYVVRSVDESANTKNKANIVPGIIPPLINEKTNIVEPGVFNYVLTGIVTMHYYLPTPINTLIVIVVLALFITSLSNYLMLSSRVYVKDFVEPLDIFTKYGDIGKLWIARMVIVITAFEGLIISHFLMATFDLILYFKILVGVLSIPVLLLIILVNKK